MPNKMTPKSPIRSSLITAAEIPLPQVSQFAPPLVQDSGWKLPVQRPGRGFYESLAPSLHGPASSPETARPDLDQEAPGRNQKSEPFTGEKNFAAI